MQHYDSNKRAKDQRQQSEASRQTAFDAKDIPRHLDDPAIIGSVLVDGNELATPLVGDDWGVAFYPTAGLARARGTLRQPRDLR
jgi:hypothetical protein